MIEKTFLNPCLLYTSDDFDGEMDDASYHIESIEEKELPIDPLNAYNHMAIYLRWCMEHDLMGEEFLAEYGEVVEKVKADSDVYKRQGWHWFK